MSGKERILKSAEKFFGRMPYREVSIAPILADAEVQAPTLYYHFRDKEGLYIEWVESAFAPLQLTVRHMDGLEDGLAAFASMFFTAVNFDLPQLIRDMEQLSRDESRERAYSAYFKAVYEPLCALLIGGMEKGELPPEPVGRVADLFLASIEIIKQANEPDIVATGRWISRRFLFGHAAIKHTI